MKTFFVISIVIFMILESYFLLKRKKTFQEFVLDKNLFLLSQITENKEYIVQEISPEAAPTLRNRLLDLGFVKGSVVSLYLPSPMNDPKAYLIRNTIIALRNDQSQYIIVKPLNNESNNL